jgi:hypothetical protein
MSAALDGAPPGAGETARIQSIARAKAILDVLAASDGGFVQLREIAAATGLVKATAFNLVTRSPMSAWSSATCGEGIASACRLSSTAARSSGASTSRRFCAPLSCACAPRRARP